MRSRSWIYSTPPKIGMSMSGGLSDPAVQSVFASYFGFRVSGFGRGLEARAPYRTPHMAVDALTPLRGPLPGGEETRRLEVVYALPSPFGLVPPEGGQIRARRALPAPTGGEETPG